MHFTLNSFLLLERDVDIFEFTVKKAQIFQDRMLLKKVCDFEFYNSKSVISQCMSSKMSQGFCSVSSNSRSASLVDWRDSERGHGNSSGITEWCVIRALRLKNSFVKP